MGKIERKYIITMTWAVEGTLEDLSQSVEEVENSVRGAGELLVKSIAVNIDGDDHILEENNY
jgi:hypothetical protein